MNESALRLLLVEDNDDDAMLIVHTLERDGFAVDCVRVESSEEFAQAFSRGSDLIISDYDLPTCTGFDILRLFKEADADIPFIIVSGAIREELAVEAMRQGAHDYVMKETLARLGPAVRRELEEARGRRAKLKLEAGYRSLVENSVQGLAIIEGTELTFVNSALATILDVDREALVGLPVTALAQHIHPEDRIVAAARFDGSAGSKRNNGCDELRLIRSSGEVRWVELEATHLELDGERVVQGAFIDITRRKQHERELEAIATLAAALRTTRNRPQMISVLLDQTIKLLGAHGAALATQAPDRDEVEFELARGAWGGLVEGRFAANSTLSGQILATGEAFIGVATDVADRLAFPAVAAETSQLAAVPMIVEDFSLGVLWIGRATPILEGDLRVLTAIADMAASALRRASLHEETRLRLHRLHALRSIDLAITTSHDLQFVFDVLLEQVLGQIGVDGASVLRHRPVSRTFVRVAARGKGLPDLSGEVSASVGFAALAGSSRKMVRTDRLDQKHNTPQENALAKAGFSTYIGIPLVAGGELRGVMELHHRGRLETDAEKDAFLETLAWQAAIAIDGRCLVEELQDSNRDLAAAYDSTLEGWARALELRDQETEGHTRRVAQLSVELARSLGVEGHELTQIKRGALLHDIGKMAIPDSVLLKPGPLNDGEWEIMRRHPQFAVEMLSGIDYLRPALTIPYGHHERWDGSGYPRGLKGKDIPLAARVFAVVDVWDALCSDRPYREAWPESRAQSYVQEHAGTLFDPDVVKRFIRVLSSDDFSSAE